jgi:hypothetical protein
MCTTYFNNTFHSNSLFVVFICFSGQTASVFLNLINRLVFIMEIGCVFLDIEPASKTFLFIITAKSITAQVLGISLNSSLSRHVSTFKISSSEIHTSYLVVIFQDFT